MSWFGFGGKKKKPEDQYKEKLNQLENLGYSDRKKNIQLLRSYAGDVNLVIKDYGLQLPTSQSISPKQQQPKQEQPKQPLDEEKAKEEAEKEANQNNEEAPKEDADAAEKEEVEEPEKNEEEEEKQELPPDPPQTGGYRGNEYHNGPYNFGINDASWLIKEKHSTVYKTINDASSWLTNHCTFYKILFCIIIILFLFSINTSHQLNGEECEGLLKKHQLLHILPELKENGFNLSMWTDITSDMLEKMGIKDSDKIKFHKFQKELEDAQKSLIYRITGISIKDLFIKWCIQHPQMVYTALTSMIIPIAFKVWPKVFWVKS